MDSCVFRSCGAFSPESQFLFRRNFFGHQETCLYEAYIGSYVGYQFVRQKQSTMQFYGTLRGFCPPPLLHRLHHCCAAIAAPPSLHPHHQFHPHCCAAIAIAIAAPPKPLLRRHCCCCAA
jgi:hypothetical protein